ncbi:mechanosensitive ion channel family protein [Alteromonas sp. C1M14]|uniref:mechanosensitive ion channel family protein n=1 Tax=Alteromonas sp. C1M14 TaxID=2841567 RepID=UPI001C099804|nr:mechanosensitive ion channel family protein [Alteromonas sp. C1M14]MBU2979935.1 mechanosensitive ion channel family protein [Alteromonas sp. C1M14]
MPDTSPTSSISTLGSDLLAHLPDVAMGLVIFVVLIFIASPVASFVLKPFHFMTGSPLLRSVVRRSVSILIILLGAYIFLKMAGLTEFAVAIVSGTGLIGLILGFAFRDIAENFISSLLLTVQRPFRIGDVVEIAGYTGVIQKVTSRATTLVDFDGNHIQLPNATVYKGIIKNLTANPNMRGHFVIGVGYDNVIAEVRELAAQLLRDHPHVLTEPEPMVLIDNLGSSTVNLKVYFWINVEASSILKMASSLMRLLTEAFLDAGISMPDDAREVVFPDGFPLDNPALKNQSSNLSSPAGGNRNTTPAAKRQVKGHDHQEDVTSENDDIRRQAEQSRDPEDGTNILE